MADSKEIAVKASVDIGDNITKLMEKLAQQIGTTADKVFPWYVKQQVIEGWVYLGVSAGFLLVGLCILVLSLRKTDFEHGNKWVIGDVIGGIITVIALLSLAIGTAGSIKQIKNPQYYAIKSMTSDMAALISR